MLCGSSLTNIFAILIVNTFSLYLQFKRCEEFILLAKCWHSIFIFTGKRYDVVITSLFFFLLLWSLITVPRYMMCLYIVWNKRTSTFVRFVLKLYRKLGVRCEHFSSSKSTETVWTMANVFIFRSLKEIHTIWKYTRYCFGSVRSKCTILSMHATRYCTFCLSLYRASTEEKPAPVWMGNWMSV